MFSTNVLRCHEVDALKGSFCFPFLEEIKGFHKDVKNIWSVALGISLCNRRTFLFYNLVDKGLVFMEGEKGCLTKMYICI